MPRLASPIVKRAMVIIRQVSEGKEKFVREPYNIISLDYGDGSPINTFIEPTCGRALAPSEKAEEYDEIRYHDTPPYPFARIGYAR